MRTFSKKVQEGSNPLDNEEEEEVTTSKTRSKDTSLTSLRRGLRTTAEEEAVAVEKDSVMTTNHRFLIPGITGKFIKKISLSTKGKTHHSLEEAEVAGTCL
jgi:hypothetical protein